MLVATKNDEKNEDTLLFYAYNYDDGVFKNDPMRSITFKEAEVKSVVANDINGDGFIDIIATLYDTKKNTYEMEVYLFNEDIGSFSKYYSYTIDNTNIIVADINGDELYYFH
jgi:hypothetical protein